MTLTGTPEALGHLALAIEMGKRQRALDALCDALPYIEDVLGNTDQLRCFKPGTVEKHAAAVRAAIESLSN